MNIANVGGIEIAYDSLGDEADETILLIAGLGTQMIRWAVPFCERLAMRGYRVIRFDNRDTGCSTHLSQYAAPNIGALVASLMAGRQPQLAYTLHDMAADAIGLLDVLDIGRAHVVGRSMGGMIAQIMASEHAERVSSLTSIMSSTGNQALPQAEPDIMAMMMRPAPDPVADQAGFISHHLAFARRIAGTSYRFDEDACRSLVLEEVRRAYDPAGAARQLAAMVVAGDRRVRLSAIAVPTLVIHGTDDPLIPPACGKDTALSIPNAAFMQISGMGHDLPPEFYPIIADAIEQTARKASS